VLFAPVYYYTESNVSNPTPLWQQPIEVLGLTGEFASGKTLFGLTIAPGPQTLCYDNEKSSGTYTSLGFERVDVPAELQRSHPNGYKPVDTFNWWLNHVRAIPAGKFRVIVLDPVSEIESGLVDWVRTHPAEFGRTAAQYANAAGLMWGDVKEHWKAILADLASRCETFAFTSHMANVWERSGPTGKRKAKGKETLMELASLYLQLERKKDVRGNQPAKPSAVVLKSRLSSIRVNADTGDVDIVPTLPPRLPEATPAAIRKYMSQPPDYAKLTPDELAPEAVMTEDQKLELRNQTATAERETEQLKLARLEREQTLRQKVQTAGTTAKPQAMTPTPMTNGTGESAGVTDAQLAELSRLRTRLWEVAGDISPDARTARWSGVLARRNVKSAKELTKPQADELIAALAARVNKEEPLDKLFRGDGVTSEPSPNDAAATAAAAAAEPAAGGAVWRDVPTAPAG
jgi:hypothetical protein